MSKFDELKTHADIHKARLTLEKQRTDLVRKALREYDEDVYGPALKAIQAKCAVLGHKPRFTHVNAFGVPKCTCSVCWSAKIETPE